MNPVSGATSTKGCKEVESTAQPQLLPLTNPGQEKVSACAIQNLPPSQEPETAQPLSRKRVREGAVDSPVPAKIAKQDPEVLKNLKAVLKEKFALSDKTMNMIIEGAITNHIDLQSALKKLQCLDDRVTGTICDCLRVFPSHIELDFGQLEFSAAKCDANLTPQELYTLACWIPYSDKWTGVEALRNTLTIKFALSDETANAIIDEAIKNHTDLRKASKKLIRLDTYTSDYVRHHLRASPSSLELDISQDDFKAIQYHLTPQEVCTLGRWIPWLRDSTTPVTCHK